MTGEIINLVKVIIKIKLNEIKNKIIEMKFLKFQISRENLIY